MEISLGQTASVVRQVADTDTAAAVGSGDLPVLGTPILLAWLEAATVAVCGATDQQTTVGTRIAVRTADRRRTTIANRSTWTMYAM